MADLGIPERVELIKENLAEVLDFKIIEDVLAEGRNPKIYWGWLAVLSRSPEVNFPGTATTGRPHCGYFVPAIKIAQFLSAGCEVVCLLADM
jgi:tyrosyl-tRNA synthetase